MSLLDLLFPKLCVSCHTFGTYICAPCFAKIRFLDAATCVACQRPAIGGMTHPVCLKPLLLDGVLSSVAYSGVVKRLVYRFKYRPYIRDLEETLISLFYEGMIQQETLFRLLHQKLLFVPIPLHPARFRMRGYNQSAILAKGLGKRFNISVADILVRVRNTPSQVGKSQQERVENIKGAFALKQSIQIEKGIGILLIDDVYTSGATLKEAAKILKRMGVGRVWGVTFAHGE